MPPLKVRSLVLWQRYVRLAGERALHFSPGPPLFLGLALSSLPLELPLPLALLLLSPLLLLVSLVVAHLALHPEDEGWLVDLLLTPRARTADTDIDRAITAFREGGALHEVLLRIERESEAVRTSPVLSREPRLHDVALELCAWMSLRAVSNDPTP